MVDLLASDHREQRQGQAGPPQLLGLRDAVALRVPLSQYPVHILESNPSGYDPEHW